MAHHTPEQKSSTQKSEAANASKAERGTFAAYQFADFRSGTVLQRQQQELIQRQSKDSSANQAGLPSPLKHGIEQLSGIAMDDVRVHYNSAKPAQFQAHAYAQGTDIHLAAGQEKHLAHEAWHVVQQKQGRVRPTIEVNGAGVNTDKGLEREADRMGAKALANGKDLSRVQQRVSTNRNVLSRKGIHLDKEYSKGQSKDTERTGGHGRLKNKGKMNRLIAPIQRVDELPSLGNTSKRSSAVGNPQGSSTERPAARRGLIAERSTLESIIKLEHVNGNNTYQPPGLSRQEEEGMKVGRAAATMKRIQYWIIEDFNKTVWKINEIDRIIGNIRIRRTLTYDEKVLTQEEKNELIEDLTKLQQIQMFWLNEIDRYEQLHNSGQRAVSIRTHSDGALTRRAFALASGGGDSKLDHLGHLAPIAKSIFNLLANLF